MSLIRLSHGTGMRHLPSIKKRGLAPRKKMQSTWDKCPSHPNRVYLTDAYAFYFALNAIGDSDDEDLLIVEVEVDSTRLYPDEDFLAQITQKGLRKGEDLLTYTIRIRDELEDVPPSSRRGLAEKSLEGLGTASYPGKIAASAVTRMACIPAKDAARIVVTEFDPFITVMNYHIFKAEYRAFQDSLFSRYPLSDS